MSGSNRHQKGHLGGEEGYFPHVVSDNSEKYEDTTKKDKDLPEDDMKRLIMKHLLSSKDAKSKDILNKYLEQDLDERKLDATMREAKFNFEIENGKQYLEQKAKSDENIERRGLTIQHKRQNQRFEIEKMESEKIIDEQVNHLNFFRNLFYFIVVFSVVGLPSLLGFVYDGFFEGFLVTIVFLLLTLFAFRKPKSYFSEDLLSKLLSRSRTKKGV